MSDKAVADQAAACLVRQDPFIWGDGSLDANITRAEVAAIVQRILKASDLT